MTGQTCKTLTNYHQTLPKDESRRVLVVKRERLMHVYKILIFKFKFVFTEYDSTLVKLFTTPDMNGLPCIMNAISRQSLPCIEPLLKKLQDLDFSSYNIDKMDAIQTRNRKNVFHIAAQMVRKEEIINIMCNYRMMDNLADSPDSSGTTPLIVACQYKNHLMARMLVLEKKAKIDHVDNHKNSPIYMATINGSGETLKCFLKKGKSFNLLL